MKKLMILMLAAVFLSAAPAWGLDLNLTGAGSGAVNGAFFTTNDFAATGSGVIYSFVRVQSNETIVQGYNTDGRPLPYDENNSPTFTRSLQLTSVPIVNMGGTNYREFFLDINQLNNSPNISLDRLIVWLAASGDYKGATLNPAGSSLVYSLDIGVNGDSSVLLNYALNSGSGSGDLFVYIPDSLFVGGTYVYLYSQFSLNNDGFEEWAVRSATPPPPVPEPTSMLLLGLGLVGLAGAGRFQKVI